MSKTQYLSGTPWHVEKMTRQEGDDKRHRSRCVNYEGKKTGHCKVFNEKCHGSAHCGEYKEIVANTKAQHPSIIKVRSFESFEGIQHIPIADIIIDDKFIAATPSKEKVKELKQYVSTYGSLDKPIVVSSIDKGYKLEDKYLRYYVAKQLGFDSIPAEMGTKEEIKIYDQLRRKGTLVWIKNMSEVGEVIEHTFERIKIRLDSGEEISYDMHKSIKSGTIIVMI